MRERDIVRYLRKRVKAAGGEMRKVSYEGRRAALDWLVLLPGRAFWAETKRPGENLEPHQKREMEKLWRAGLEAVKVNSIEQIDKLLERYPA